MLDVIVRALYWILADILQFQTVVVSCPVPPIEAVVHCYVLPVEAVVGCLSLSLSYLKEFRGRNSFKEGRL